MAPYTSLTLTHIQNIKGLPGGSRSSAARTAYPSGVMYRISHQSRQGTNTVAHSWQQSGSHIWWSCGWRNKTTEIPWDTLWQNADLQKTCGNNSTEAQERSISPEGYGCKGYWTTPSFLGVYIPSSTELNCRVPGEIKRREVGLDPQVSPEEIMNREVELGCESWTSFASGCSPTAVQRTLSLWLCQARQLKQQLRSALVAAQWRGDTALTLPLFWRRSTVSPVFFGRYPRSSLHSLALSQAPPPPPPPSTVPVPYKQPRFCGCKAEWSKWTELR